MGIARIKWGDILKWYTVLASASVAAELDLQTHHGILDVIALDRVMGKKGNTDGYFSLGDLILTPENLGVACKWTI